MRLAILHFRTEPAWTVTNAHWLLVYMVIAMLFLSGALELNLKAQPIELWFLCLKIVPNSPLRLPLLILHNWFCLGWNHFHLWTIRCLVLPIGHQSDKAWWTVSGQSPQDSHTGLSWGHQPSRNLAGLRADICGTKHGVDPEAEQGIRSLRC